MSEQDYLKRRIAEEQAATAASADPRAATVHRALAGAYEKQLMQMLTRRAA